jgi:hypothetical protein
MKTFYELNTKAQDELRDNLQIRRAYYNSDAQALRDLKANADLIEALESGLPVTNDLKEELDMLEPYGKPSDGIEPRRPRPKKTAAR